MCQPPNVPSITLYDFSKGRVVTYFVPLCLKWNQKYTMGMLLWETHLLIMLDAIYKWPCRIFWQCLKQQGYKKARNIHWFYLCIFSFLYDNESLNWLTEKTTKWVLLWYYILLNISYVIWRVTVYKMRIRSLVFVQTTGNTSEDNAVVKNRNLTAAITLKWALNI